MLGARRELGPELEPEVIDAFADRVERAIDARVDARLGQRGGGAERRGTDRSSLLLALGSLGVGYRSRASARRSPSWRSSAGSASWPSTSRTPSGARAVPESRSLSRLGTRPGA
jgi:hypothetical protein